MLNIIIHYYENAETVAIFLKIYKFTNVYIVREHEFVKRLLFSQWNLEMWMSKTIDCETNALSIE